MFRWATIIILTGIVLFVHGSIPIKHIEVNNVNELSFTDKSSIFEPAQYLSSNKKTAQHNINIFDKFGKFIRLNYFSQYGDHIDIFELKPNGLNDIKSVQCINDNINTIKITFNNKYTALKYTENINLHLQNDKDNKYFVTGSHEWKCYNKKEKKYTPILRTIMTARIDRNIDDKLLILSTNYASYTELFENLEMLLETNANMDGSSNKLNKMVEKPAVFESRRKLLCNKRNIDRVLLCDETPEGSSLWDDIVNGVESLWDTITSVIDDIADFVNDIEDIYEDATELWDALTTGDYTENIDATLASWKYNYNGAASSSVLDLDSKVSCQSCYAFADLTYSIKISINDYELTYFKLTGTGDIKLNIEIEASEKYSDEFSTKTCQISVPDLGFSIAGIHFGFSIYGEFAVGIDVEMAFSYTIYATASITRGIEWDSTTNSQNYIEEQSFDHGSIGPILDFKASSITVYGRATLYLVLSLVGDVYIGVQPKYIVSLSEDANYGASSGCAVDYTPSATITIFVGATINLAQKKSIWSKQTNVATYTLPAGSSGCITHSDITSLETWADGINSWWRRRRNMLLSDDINTKTTTTQFFVNYTRPNIAYKSSFKWGKKHNIWHANLTVLSKSCNNNNNITLPKYGNLMIYPQDNNGDIMYGIYKTINHISSNDGYIITTDVNCVARYEFIKIDGKYNKSDKIYRYNVNLIDNDYKCDVNESILNNIKNEWFHQTHLPSKMDAVLLDSAFNTILLHDINDCYIFPLTKNKKLNKYQFKKNDIIKFENKTYEWPSKTWFGSFHCEEKNISDSLSLYFNSINWKTGNILNVNSTLLIRNNGDKAIGIGLLNINDLTLDFDFYDMFGQHILNINGFITVLQDGCLLYSGVTPSEPKCTGFIFQGYINMDQFKYNDNNNNIHVVIDDDDKGDIDNNYHIGAVIGFIVIGFLFALIFIFSILCLIMKCNGYRFVKNDKNVHKTYQLMQDENL